MIVFHNRLAFWLGIAATCVGVALHFPMYVESRHMDYHMVGMPIDAAMWTGMVLILVGLGLSVFGLVPRVAGSALDRMARIRVQAMDEAPIRAAHVALLLVMAGAVTIDVMKPTTIAFVIPGMSEEYGLKSAVNPDGGASVAWFPFAALTGLTLGAIIWGWFGDRVGRRAAILISGVMFIGTSICGAMPSFELNMLVCFVMGLAVGGMLPIAFALLAETIPARHRSWLMVLIGGDVAGAYLLTSTLASELQPEFGWRIMWLIGLPTGIMMILLNRWIPESPRFLMATGRPEEAKAVMERFGARVVEVEDAQPDVEDAVEARYGQLFRRPFGGLTIGVALFGIGWGLVNNGFLLWLPTNLRDLGFGVGAAEGILADSALIGFPAVFVVAVLYGFWSSKGTMIILAALTAATLTAFAVMGDGVGEHTFLLKALIVLLLVGNSAVLAMLTPYSSEVYPTRIRARGTGLSGMCARGGGFLAAGGVVAGISPSLTLAAVIGAVPIALAAIAVNRYGVETRRRGLEEITAAELASEVA